MKSSTVPPGPAAPLIWALVLVAAAVSVGMGRVVFAPATSTQHHAGPFGSDYVDIADVPVGAPAPAAGPDASTGSYVSSCGRNENGHLNADNLVRAPGVPSAAHHVHEYVGNTSTNGLSTPDSLAAADTTCAAGDLSTYYWPVLRVLGEHTTEPTAGANTGRRITPSSVLVRFTGSAVSDVVPMPRFLRLVTGDAHAWTNKKTDSARWTCTGYEDRTTSSYPLCPNGVVRVFDFPSCWDGRRLDSAGHRAHAVFPDPRGVCPQGFFPVPHLVVQVRYDVPAGASYAVDSFPEELRHPGTDHADFVDVMPEQLRARLTRCVNDGLSC